MERLPLTFEQCQRARMARDKRFDGCFYIAVKTTKIFCRPICPANLPLEKNVEYYFDQAQALKAGYRPCLRCRPDSAPSSWAWKGTETSFQRAIKLIDEGVLYHHGVTDLAKKLGISDRYLRKLFDKYLGMSPKQYALYHQLMFAKELLYTSSLNITDVAFASGFNSVRRFNDAFKNDLKLTPSQVKKANNEVGTASIQLAVNTPFHWQHILAFYRMRAIDGVEEVGENHYARQIWLNESTGWFKATFNKHNILHVEFRLEAISDLKLLVLKLKRMFDLDVNITEVEQHLNNVAPNLVTEPGIRIPGVWSTWEAGVRAVLGQQVSVKAAIGQLNSLVKTLNTQSDTLYFPTPKQVANADLSFLKMPNSRKETLKRFAQFVIANPDADPKKWIDIKGIGPWTINYAQLRGQSLSDCFLSGDLVVKKAAAKHPNMSPERISPWGSYATLHCWNTPL